MTLEERGEVELCNHFLAVVNADQKLGALAGSTRMQLNVAPAPSRYMLDLERENRTLWRTNQRLARDKLAVADSAAASALRPPPRGRPPGAAGAAGDRRRAGGEAGWRRWC